MSAYVIVLFIHLCALVAAIGAAALVGLAMNRAGAARVCGEALEWLATVKPAAPIFPLAMLTLVGSGAYMVHEAWTWSTGFVDAGLTGVAAVAFAVLVIAAAVGVALSVPRRRGRTSAAAEQVA